MNLRKDKCRVCRRPVLKGDSDPVAALTVVVDDNSLGHLGEALARLDGRRTFTLTRHGRGRRLRTRDRWQIGGGRSLSFADVVAEHRCGPPLPSIPSKLSSPDLEGPADVCPF